LLKKLIVISLFVCLASLTAFSQTINDSQIIDIAKEDAKTAFEEGLFREASNWKIDGWLRVVSEPIFRYFDNLSEDQQGLYKYILTVELNKLYFQSLMDSGEKIDPFFFNQDLWDRISIMPLTNSDIQNFVKAIIDNPNYAFTRGDFDEIDEMEVKRVFPMYELNLLFPKVWNSLFILEFNRYLFL